jgi:hypothetical protein
MVWAKEAELLEALRGSPEGLRVPALAGVTGSSVAAVADRLRRLMLRGEAERSGREWRIPRNDDAESDDELAPVTPEPGPENPRAWMKPIGRFVRRDTSEFSCRRYG